MDPHDDASARLGLALTAPDASARLRTAMAAGTRPDPAYVPVLVARCAVEADPFVRDTLTWALLRHPADATLPLLLAEVRDGGAQARSQALHTLSKIRDPRGWAAVTPALLQDPDERVARSAWRAAVLLAPEDQRDRVAGTLATQLGRGERDVQAGLSRAFLELGRAADEVLARAEAHADPAVRLHAVATRRFVQDPDAGFEAAHFEAEHELVLAESRERPADGRDDGPTE